MSDLFETVKRESAGRTGEIIAATTPLPAEVVKKKGQDHSCTGCKGKSTIWPANDAERTGSIACRNCTNNRQTGDIINTVATFNGIPQGEAAKLIAAYLGIDTAATNGPAPQPLGIVAQVAKAKGMPLEAFLKFGPEVAKRGRDKKPVARVPVYDAAGEIHSHFDITPKDKGFFKRGEGSSGVFFPGRLPKPGETWLLPEGVKDAAALVDLGFNAAGMPTSFLDSKYARLFKGVNVVCVPDLDTPGQQGAKRTGGNLSGVAASVRVARLPGEIVETGGDDTRDVIRRDGPAAVREAIDNAEVWQPREGAPPKDTRPEVTLTLRYAWHVDQVIGHLGRLGWESSWLPEAKREARKLYQRGGLLVDVVDEIRTDATAKGGKVAIAKGTPRIRTLPIQQLPLRIADACQLLTERVKGDELVIEAVPPPRWLNDGVFTAGGYGDAIRPLDGIITAPTIRADGSVLQKAGWDKHTGLLFRPSMKFAEVPDKPTQPQAAEAAAKLLDVVADFPFFTDADRAAWLTMLLSMIGRPCIAGHVPLFAVTANIRGAGKSMLVDVASFIAYGHGAARTPYTADDDEMRKRITAIAIEGSPAVLLDNLDRPIGGASLDAALTADRWKDRELQHSRNVDLALHAVWTATGNNLQFRSDIARRVLPIRLDSPLEKPEERTGFRHPDLLGWVRHHRGELVTAALTILRAYFVADCPRQKGGTFGSFERWSDVIRGAVVWAGMADPMATRETADDDDQSIAVVRGLIGGLLEIDETGDGLTCREIVKLLEGVDPERFPAMREVVAEVATERGAPNAKRLTYAMRKYRGRVSGGFRLSANKGHGGVNRWSAVPVNGDHGDHGDHVSDNTHAGSCVFPPNTNSDTHRGAYRDEGKTSSPSSPWSPSPPSTPQPAEGSTPAPRETKKPCPRCGRKMVAKGEAVGGWLTLDCLTPGCGHVCPAKVSAVTEGAKV